MRRASLVSLRFELYTAILRLAQKESAFDRVIALIEVHAQVVGGAPAFLPRERRLTLFALACLAFFTASGGAFGLEPLVGSVGTRLVRYLDTGHSPHLEHADGIDGG